MKDIPKDAQTDYEQKTKDYVREQCFCADSRPCLYCEAKLFIKHIYFPSLEKKHKTIGLLMESIQGSSKTQVILSEEIIKLKDLLREAKKIVDDPRNGYLYDSIASKLKRDIEYVLNDPKP